MTKATIDDVAALAGVSIKTVSRVVNQEPNVRDATRERVEKAIAELNYQPNQAARTLASHQSRLISLVYEDPTLYVTPSSGFIIRMQEGALQACHKAGYALLIHPLRHQEKNARKNLTRHIEIVRPDGVVLAAPLSNVEALAKTVEATGTPFVRISPGTSRCKQFSVSTNDREVSAEMTRYLASLGHRRIAFIAGDPSHKAVSHRLLGYKDGLADSGLPFDEELVGQGNNLIDSGEVAAEKLLALPRPPTAIFAANDDMAAGVVRVADRLGIKVPDQLSVAGCDDVALAQLIYPALTTINQPLASMAGAAVESLIESIRTKDELSGEDILPAEIRVRDSTAPPPPTA
ncbi:MAG: LacI family DNA-binding transcriptional regulator [Gammaproteobacteria bacterium]|nr:LacI family DNA-binding transcriptional regulator [Gammaproteobacteria bacterium]